MAKVKRIFGHIPGMPVGKTFATRKQAWAAGVHRQTVNGISGTEETGAESIVLSGAYEDDDRGAVIVYTGHGGRKQDSSVHTHDQELGGEGGSGNAALALNEQTGNPVRVLRGAKAKSVYAPVEGYRYDGLYRVTSHWARTGRDGYRIWQFRLVQVDDDDQFEPVPMRQELGLVPPPPPIKTGTVQRVVRSTAVVKQVKEMYQDTCQFCGTRLVVNNLGMAYSEGAHIQALAEPHRGPDVIENLLCLCANCHVLFDNGARYVTKEWKVVDGLTHTEIGELTKVDDHAIGAHYVEQHRRRWNIA